MAIFPRRRREGSPSPEPAPEGEGVSTEIDYEAKARRAKYVAIGASIIGGVLAAGFIATGAIFGVAMYTLMFAGVTVGVAGVATIVGSMLARRKYKKLAKTQRMIKERNEGKTKRGKVLSTDKQASLDNKINRNVRSLTKKNRITGKQYITDAQGKNLAEGKDGARSAHGSRAAREAILSMLNQNRQELKDNIEREVNRFRTTEADNYTVDETRKGKIDVLAVDYDDEGAVRLDSEDNPILKPICTIESSNYADFLKSHQQVYQSIKDATNIEYPITIKVTTNTGESDLKEITSKDDVIKYLEKLEPETNSLLEGMRVPAPSPTPPPPTPEPDRDRHL